MGSSNSEGVHLSAVRIRTIKQTVLYIIFLRPLFSFSIANKIGAITIFKVKDDFRTLTKSDFVNQCNIAILDRNINSCNGFIRG